MTLKAIIFDRAATSQARIDAAIKYIEIQDNIVASLKVNEEYLKQLLDSYQTAIRSVQNKSDEIYQLTAKLRGPYQC